MKKKTTPKQPRKSHFRGILAAAGAIALLAGLGFGLHSYQNRFPAIRVGDHSISDDAYDWALSQARKEILSQFANAGVALTDWNGETELGTPCELAADRALEILQEFYAVSELAVERGYLTDASFESAEADRVEYNRLRRETLESGGIVTGITEFSRSQYMEYRASGLRREFCNDDTNPEMTVSSEDIADRYALDKDSLYQAQDTLTLGVVLLDVPEEDGESYEQALQALSAAARERGSLEEAARESELFRDAYQEMTIDNSNYSYYDRSQSDVLYWSEDLNTGEFSPVYNVGGRLCLIQCIQRVAVEYVPLEDVSSVVAQSVRESRYDDLIAQRSAALEISGDLAVLYRYSARQLT